VLELSELELAVLDLAHERDHLLVLLALGATATRPFASEREVALGRELLHSCGPLLDLALLHGDGSVELRLGVGTNLLDELEAREPLHTSRVVGVDGLVQGIELQPVA